MKLISLLALLLAGCGDTVADRAVELASTSDVNQADGPYGNGPVDDAIPGDDWTETEPGATVIPAMAGAFCEGLGGKAIAMRQSSEVDTQVFCARESGGLAFLELQGGVWVWDPSTQNVGTKALEIKSIQVGSALSGACSDGYMIWVLDHTIEDVDGVSELAGGIPVCWNDSSSTLWMPGTQYSWSDVHLIR